MTTPTKYSIWDNSFLKEQTTFLLVKKSDTVKGNPARIQAKLATERSKKLPIETSLEYNHTLKPISKTA